MIDSHSRRGTEKSTRVRDRIDEQMQMNHQEQEVNLLKEQSHVVTMAGK